MNIGREKHWGVLPHPWGNFNTAERATLGLVVVLALTLRVYGVDFGLPYVYDPDEPAFVEPALRMVFHGDLNPHWFGHPGSTVIYLNAALYKLLDAIGRVLGWFSDWSEFRSFYLADPTLFYLVPRVVDALIGMVTVLLVFLVTRELYGGPPALVAALALAVAPLHVYYSQLIRTDVLMSALVLLVGYHALCIARTRSLGAYLWAGAITGAAAATKYPAVAAASMVLSAHLAAGAGRAGEAWKLIAAGAATVGALFVFSPYLFLDHETVIRNLQVEARSSHLSATGTGFIENLWWYISVPLARSAGWPALWLSLLAVFVATRKHLTNVIVLATFPLVFLGFIASLSLRWERWVVPLLPFLAVLTAGGLEIVSRFVWTRWRGMPERGLIYGAAVAMLFPVASTAVLQAVDRALPDTRTVARDWIMANVPAGSRLLIEVYGPQLPRSRYQLFEVSADGFEGSSDHVITIPPGEAANVVPPFKIVGTLDSIATLSENRIDYVVLSNIYDRYLQEAVRYRRNVANYESLFGIAELVQEIAPLKGQLQGPRIRVLRLPAATAPLPPPVADPE